MVQVGQNETIEDLQYKGLKIIQPKSGYRFTTDAVLLANFVSNAKGKNVVELCAGSGVIATLIAAKQQPKQILAIELQRDMADMAARSVAMNCLEGQIKVICADARDISKSIGANNDIVVVNPPYRKVGAGQTQKSDAVSICRHEICMTLNDVFEESSHLLKFGGSLYLVHQFERLAEAVIVGQKYGLAAKVLRLVMPNAQSAPNLFLARFVLGGKQGLKWQPPIVVFDDNGQYSVTIKQLYGESFAFEEGK